MKRLLKRIWDRLVMLAEVMAVVFFLAAPAMAEEPLQLARMSGPMLGSGGEVVSSCNSANDYVGDKTDYYASQTGMVADNLVCMLYTPTCSGTLSYPSANVADSGEDTKMGVFLDDGDSTPDSGDTLVGSWQIVTSKSFSSGFVEGSSELGGGVSVANNYFVCILASAATALVRTVSGSRTLYSVGGVSYSSPPTTLPSGMTGNNTRDISFFVKIK